LGLAAVAGLSISGALIFALNQGERKTNSATELYNTANKPTADGLATLPRDYTGLSRDVPVLGPPLPGDLGRPIRNAQLNAPGEPAIDVEQQRVAQETEAARTSRLFATTNVREHPANHATLPMSASTEQEVATPIGRGDGTPLDPDSLLNMQDRKRAFLTAPVDRKTVSPDRLATPPSRYVVQAGAVIPAALITGIRSDLPGQVTAQVTENIYDTPPGGLIWFG
jgi:type IV secretion system protein VirB10